MADLVERDVGKGDVLFENRGVAAPLGVAVAEDQLAVGQRQQFRRERVLKISLHRLPDACGAG